MIYLAQALPQKSSPEQSSAGASTVRSSVPRTSPVQAGFSVSSRNFPLAIHRNRIKRLGREAYRLQKQPLLEHLAENQQFLAVFFIFTAKKIQPYDTVHRKISVILKRLTEELGD